MFYAKGPVRDSGRREELDGASGAIEAVEWERAENHRVLQTVRIDAI